ncbi:OmpA family protein [Solimonas marina]|uniref:OmpA family protein n=1 Tax=Solimonas marina TaxID=2714601 RepID=A0A969W9R8_9GAMM|nr:OmpA family protein [Solimonas marina]NKF22514.1 OmpA family protein [Solimonas marina]
MKYARIAIVAVTIATLSACATDDPNRRAKTGAVIGGIAGAVLGNNVSHATGAPYVGAALGALAGGAVGHYMDNQKAELNRQLAEEQRNKELQVTQLSDGSLKVGIASDVSFDLNSAQLKPQALDTYGKIAAILKNYDKTVIHVVGHTDTTGSDEYNMRLSESRANAVATYLEGQGVPSQRVRTEGRGERELLVKTPDNTPEARNRRVDIVIKPIVQGNEQAAWAPPPYLGS